MEGWIKIHRRLLDSELWQKPCEWRIIWLHIIMSVSHKNTSNFKIGEGLFKYDMVAKSCGVTYDNVRRCIEWLVKSQSLATQKTTRGIFIKVLNYTKYQVYDSDEAMLKATQKPDNEQNIYTSHAEISEGIQGCTQKATRDEGGNASKRHTGSQTEATLYNKNERKEKKLNKKKKNCKNCYNPPGKCAAFCLE